MPTERQIVDAITQRAFLLLRVASGIDESVNAELRALARRLRGMLAAVNFDGLGKRDLAALLRDVSAAISAAYSAIAEAVDGDLMRIGAAEARWAAGVFGLRPGQAPAGVLVLGYPIAALWEAQATTITGRAQAIVRMAASGIAPAVPGGSIAEQVVRAVVGDGPAGRERGGVIEGARTSAGTIARTAVRSAAEAAQREAWRAAGVAYVRWHSILDSRTTIGCAVRAGKIYTIDGEAVGHDVPMGVPPPAHWNCRSLLAPMAPGFWPPGDGQDIYEESLDQWLLRHPESQQDEMLGPRRAALWRAGRITTRDLLGRGGEPLSVADLVALHGGD